MTTRPAFPSAHGEEESPEERRRRIQAVQNQQSARGFGGTVTDQGFTPGPGTGQGNNALDVADTANRVGQGSSSAGLDGLGVGGTGGAAGTGATDAAAEQRAASEAEGRRRASERSGSESGSSSSSGSASSSGGSDSRGTTIGGRELTDDEQSFLDRLDATGTDAFQTFGISSPDFFSAQTLSNAGIDQNSPEDVQRFTFEQTKKLLRQLDTGDPASLSTTLNGILTQLERAALPLTTQATLGEFDGVAFTLEPGMQMVFNSDPLAGTVGWVVVEPETGEFVSANATDAAAAQAATDAREVLRSLQDSLEGLRSNNQGDLADIKLENLRSANNLDELREASSLREQEAESQFDRNLFRDDLDRMFQERQQQLSQTFQNQQRQLDEAFRIQEFEMREGIRFGDFAAAKARADATQAINQGQFAMSVLQTFGQSPELLFSLQQSPELMNQLSTATGLDLTELFPALTGDAAISTLSGVNLPTLADLQAMPIPEAQGMLRQLAAATGIPIDQIAAEIQRRGGDQGIGTGAPRLAQIPGGI